MEAIALANSAHFFFRFLILYIGTEFDSSLSSYNLSIFDSRSREGLYDMLMNHGLSNMKGKYLSWSFHNVLTLVTIRCGFPTLAGLTVLRCLSQYTFIVPLSISNSAQYFYGLYTKQNNKDLANQFAKTCAISANLFVVLTMVIMYTLGELIFKLFCINTETYT